MLFTLIFLLLQPSLKIPTVSKSTDVSCTYWFTQMLYNTKIKPTLVLLLTLLR